MRHKRLQTPEFDNIKDSEHVALLKSTKKTFSKISGECVSDDEAIEITNQFQSLLQLLDKWENEGAINLDSLLGSNEDS